MDKKDIEYEKFTYSVESKRYWEAVEKIFSHVFEIEREKAKEIIWAFGNRFVEEVEKYFEGEIRFYFEKEAYELYKEIEDMESEEHYYSTHEL